MFWFLSLLALTSCVSGEFKVFKPTATTLKSYALDNGYRLDGGADDKDRIDNMENSWYTKLNEHPQFGYSVSLAKPGDVPVVIISAPGNPSFEFSDPGFVELQKLDDPPSKVPDDYGTKVMIVSPKKANYIQAHTFFGASTTIATTAESFDYRGETLWSYRYSLYSGAPQGARCIDELWFGNETKSFDNYGKVYPDQFSIPKGVFSAKQDEPLALSEVCYKGESYIGGIKQEGFAQANRNLLGFSGHFSKDGHFLLFGAPMTRQQAGYVHINYRSKVDTDVFEKFQTNADIKLYYLCEPDELKKYKGYDSERGKDAVLRSIICDVDLTYGYSLTSLFIKGDTYLATGGTRASGLHGQIKIFKVENFEAKLLTQNFKFLKTLIGSKFNAGFGTTILGADLNGDGVDELLVGEPYRTDVTSNTYNSGGVSIFGYDEDAEEYVFKYDLKSPKASGSNMFGFKVASMGDADADGSEDILVTALSEVDGNSKGKVYLFNGRSIYSLMNNEGTKDEPTILQEFVNPNTVLFGFSIGESRQDLDGNGFNDLVIGDPGNDNQKAYVYYANTIIRLIQPEGIQRKLIKEQKIIDKNCPVDRNSIEYNFCEPLQVTLSNTGVLRKDDADPDIEAKIVPWSFKNAFDLEVSLEKEPDTNLFKIFGDKQTVDFDGTEQKIVTFYVYGQIPPLYGATVHLKALTALASGSVIELEEDYKGETLLSPETLKDLDVSVGPLADVTLQASPKQLTVVLGNPQETLVVGATVRTKSGAEEHLVNGVLKLNLGTLSVGFSSASSEPSGIATCRKENGAFVTCKFNKDKAFKEAKLSITLTVGDFVRGLVTQREFVFGHELTWGNRWSDDVLTDSSKVEIVYRSKLEIISIDGSVAEDTPYRKEGNEIDYSVNVLNAGISDIKYLVMDLYIPLDFTKFAAMETGQFKDPPTEYTGDHCTFEKCIVYTREFERIGGNKSELVVLKMKFIDGAFWKKLVNSKTDFSFHVLYKVTKAAKYGNLESEDFYPTNKEGSVTLYTKITREKAPFPWWIVVVTLLVSVAIVIITIIVLYKTNFFKKKNMNKLNENDLEDDDAIDEDMGMTAKKYTTGA